MMAFVEPPIASSTRSAFSTERSVMIWLGRNRVVARATAWRPLASAARSRSAWTAGIAAVPGNAMPSASAIEAIVLAVPITAQEPAGGEHAALHSVDQLGKVPVTVVEAARGLRDPDDRPCEHRLRVAHRRREGAPQVEREVGVAVVGEAAREAARTVRIRHVVAAAHAAPSRTPGRSPAFLANAAAATFWPPSGRTRVAWIWPPSAAIVNPVSSTATTSP